ncbi:MAG: PD-(D/E)XK nuclease family protein [Alphaproteobacteria bacterium]|nr:PD-(D/E)XK nuclease family protein [Alphaproteobacteria bacterium]
MESTNFFEHNNDESCQDAVICWILSFYNDTTSKLHNLAKDLLASFVPLTPTDTTIEIQTQVSLKPNGRIDILIILPDTKKLVIIEDKVYASEGYKQIENYIEGVSQHKDYQGYKIYAVYFKTGFYYDRDKLVAHRYNKLLKNHDKNWKCEEFKSIGGKAFLELLQKYKGQDATLDMYIEHLDKLINWYVDYGKFQEKCKDKEHSTEWNISKEFIAQHNLMRAIFPEEKWDRDKENPNDEHQLYEVYSKSNLDGRPWTHMIILSKKEYNIFWRIDTDKKGPYLSLRYYKRDKKAPHPQYSAYRDIVTKLDIVKDALAKQDKKNKKDKNWECPNKEHCREATLLHIHLNDILTHWAETGDAFIEKIRKITDDFIAQANKQFGETD